MRYSADTLDALIRRCCDFVNFGEPGTWTTEEECRALEHTLGYQLPNSLRWWLKRYKGGEILGEEVYSIYEETASNVAAMGDLLYQYHLHQKDGGQKHHLPILYSDIDCGFFLVLQHSTSRESPVISEITGEIYAEDFSEFLWLRMQLGLT